MPSYHLEVCACIPTTQEKKAEDLKKHLRPISLADCLSKVTEDCVIHNYTKPAVLKVLDPSQYGVVPHSSTTQAPLHMVHSWAQATDGNSATIRTVLFNYWKAFDLIDHRILVDKLCKLVLPTRIINWIIDFLSVHSQRIKLAEGCYSKWGSVLSGVPQGTKLGPWLFLILNNDLSRNGNFNAQFWKYVNDMVTSEVVANGGASNAQHIADCVSQWSLDNRVQLNSKKCKELRISLTKKQSELHPILANGNQLEVVRSAKLLGVIITRNFSWNEHINKTVKKASKRLYFLVQLKRAKLPGRDLVLFMPHV